MWFNFVPAGTKFRIGPLASPKLPPLKQFLGDGYRAIGGALGVSQKTAFNDVNNSTVTEVTVQPETQSPADVTNLVEEPLIQPDRIVRGNVEVARPERGPAGPCRRWI